MIQEYKISSLPLILASGSPYRKLLLQRLTSDFTCFSPDIDESPVEDETPLCMVERLTRQKTFKVAESYNPAIIIGSDQVEVANNQILGKPGSMEKAKQQLRFLSGQEVIFYTGMAVLNSQSQTLQYHCGNATVCFRDLNDDEINRYLEIESPFDCTGSFKSEALGISLTDRIVSDDPTILIGLPLIQLAKMLRTEGLAIP